MVTDAPAQDTTADHFKLVVNRLQAMNMPYNEALLFRLVPNVVQSLIQSSTSATLQSLDVQVRLNYEALIAADTGNRPAVSVQLPPDSAQQHRGCSQLNVSAQQQDLQRARNAPHPILNVPNQAIQQTPSGQLTQLQQQHSPVRTFSTQQQQELLQMAVQSDTLQQQQQQGSPERRILHLETLQDQQKQNLAQPAQHLRQQQYAPNGLQHPLPSYTVLPSGVQVGGSMASSLVVPNESTSTLLNATLPPIGQNGANPCPSSASSPSVAVSSNVAALLGPVTESTLEARQQAEKEGMRQDLRMMKRLLPSNYSIYSIQQQHLPQWISWNAALSMQACVQRPKTQFVMSTVKGTKESMMLNNSLDMGKVSLMQAQKIGGSLKGLLVTTRNIDCEAIAERKALACLARNVEQLQINFRAVNAQVATIERLESVIVEQRQALHVFNALLKQAFGTISKLQGDATNNSITTGTITSGQDMLVHQQQLSLRKSAEKHAQSHGLAADSKTMEARLSALEEKLTMLMEREEQRLANKAEKPIMRSTAAQCESIIETLPTTPAGNAVPSEQREESPLLVPGSQTAKIDATDEREINIGQREQGSTKDAEVSSRSDALQHGESSNSSREDSFSTANQQQRSEETVPPSHVSPESEHSRDWADTDGYEVACEAQGSETPEQRSCLRTSSPDQTRDSSTTEACPTEHPSSSNKAADGKLSSEVKARESDEVRDTDEEDEQPQYKKIVHVDEVAANSTKRNAKDGKVKKRTFINFFQKEGTKRKAIVIDDDTDNEKEGSSRKDNRSTPRRSSPPSKSILSNDDGKEGERHEKTKKKKKKKKKLRTQYPPPLDEEDFGNEWFTTL